MGLQVKQGNSDKQKQRLFIVFHIVFDIRSAPFDNGMSLGFQLLLLCFDPTGVFCIQFTVCL